MHPKAPNKSGNRETICMAFFWGGASKRHIFRHYLGQQLNTSLSDPKRTPRHRKHFGSVRWFAPRVACLGEDEWEKVQWGVLGIPINIIFIYIYISYIYIYIWYMEYGIYKLYIWYKKIIYIYIYTLHVFSSWQPVAITLQPMADKFSCTLSVQGGPKSYDPQW